MHISCVSKASTGGGQRSAAWGSVCRPVEQTQLGRSPQQIVEDFDGVLTLAQVYDALSYYHEHEQEIEQYIAQNREALWKGPQMKNPAEFAARSRS